jgi:hypothetical protein
VVEVGWNVEFKGVELALEEVDEMLEDLERCV